MKSMPQRQRLWETTEGEKVKKGKKGEIICSRSPVSEANILIKGRLPLPWLLVFPVLGSFLSWKCRWKWEKSYLPAILNHSCWKLVINWHSNQWRFSKSYAFPMSPCSHWYGKTFSDTFTFARSFPVSWTLLINFDSWIYVSHPSD